MKKLAFSGDTYSVHSWGDTGYEWECDRLGGLRPGIVVVLLLFVLGSGSFELLSVT